MLHTKSMVQNRGDIILSDNGKIKGKPSIFHILITLSSDADSLLFEHLVSLQDKPSN